MQRPPHPRWGWALLAALLLLGAQLPLAAHQGFAAPTGSPQAIQTRTFQQGVDGYEGSADTFISRHTWATPPQYSLNYGQNPTLRLTRDGYENPLLRFALSEVPTNSVVVSATLALYNTTPSEVARRMQLFQMLAGWEEGNQAGSPIDQAGDYGATGDHAVQYFTGEGSDIPWGARGMLAGSDYAESPVTHADIVGPGWYSWDITPLVQAWVRGDAPNLGLTLRDISGYNDNNPDERTFHANQASDPALRPLLTVVFNPDVPFAQAGPDQTNLMWDGSPLTLDGSASRDRPGGNDATLTYTWRVATPGFGSALAPGAVVASSVQPSFTPDVPGEWALELVVTNELGESATDQVHLRLLQLAPTHPRLHITPAMLPTLRARATLDNPRWSQLLDWAAPDNEDMLAQALVGLVSEQDNYCDSAIAQALGLATQPTGSSMEPGNMALVYDWCYHRLSTDQRTTLITFFNSWADESHTNPNSPDVPGWGNYWPRYSYSMALIGLATHGDNPRAQEHFDDYRHHRFRDHDLAMLDRIAEGGTWPEGIVYDWIANWPRMKAIDAWHTATGENLFHSSAWFEQRFGYLLLYQWPGVAEQWGRFYRPYPSIGDSERNRNALSGYGRIMGLILISHFPNHPLAQQLQAYLASPPANNPWGFLYHEEFLWFHPNQPSTPPSLLTHYAPGTGTLFLRSAWPSGAADTDPSATHLIFQSGDHFSYHQHYDQNSFTLFKYADLALDSGVYSGDGLSYHDQNYYVRTIAHNTLVVYNPNEDFSSARPDAVSNDGGQRTMTPASRSPETVAYFDQHAVHYDTGDMPRMEDGPGYTYALGDATKAYNNSTYNQAMDTPLSANIAKVSRFQREFVYLRPLGGPDDYLVLLDRVGVTDPAFSGANTKLLFHLFNQPTLNGTPTTISPGETLYTDADMATATNGDGKLFLKTLWPQQRHLRLVGGRGEKAFWLFDDNYDWHWDVNEPQPRPITDFDPVPYGEWRLELEPADTALEHNFLTVLYPTISTTQQMPTTTLISTTHMVGAHIADSATNRVVLFSNDPAGATPAPPITFAYHPTVTTTQHTLFNLTPGATYAVSHSFESGVQTVIVTLADETPGATQLYQASAQGVLAFPLSTSAILTACTADLNTSGTVDVADLLAITSRFNQPAPFPYDATGDGTVTLPDITLAALLWNHPCP